MFLYYIFALMIIGAIFTVLRRKKRDGKTIITKGAKRDPLELAKYRDIFFDIDGTLLDSKEMLDNALKVALERGGYGSLVTDELKSQFLGTTLTKGFKDFCGLNEDVAKELTEYFREYYIEHIETDVRLYPGIKEMLERLSASGRRLYVVTNGQTSLAEHAMEVVGIKNFFIEIAGLDDIGDDVTKADTIQVLMKKRAITDRPATVMVGDRFFDISAARGNLISTIGVTYGYGDRKELEEAKAQEVVDTIEELESLLLSEEAN